MPESVGLCPIVIRSSSPGIRYSVERLAKGCDLFAIGRAMTFRARTIDRSQRPKRFPRQAHVVAPRSAGAMDLCAVGLLNQSCNVFSPNATTGHYLDSTG